MSTHDFDLPDLERRIADPAFKVPDLMEAVEGWRTWRVPADPPPYGLPPKLYSATHGDYFWAPRKAMRAECDKCDQPGKGGIPGEHHTCGFYSAKTLDHLLTMDYHRRYDEGWMCIIGRLANWGKVIEGSQGWRAEWAYPIEFYVPFEFLMTHAKPLREGYGVPVKPLNVLGAKPQAWLEDEDPDD
jgi:hypothetical protein